MDQRTRKVFEILVRESEGSLTAFIRSLVRDPGLVDDVFQETLLTAWKRFDDFDQSRPLGPWLRGIALNHVRNAARRRAKDIHYFTDAITEAIDHSFTEIESLDGDSWEGKLQALGACLNALPDASRHLIDLRYRSLQTATQISEQLTIPALTIRKRLQRIREVVADCLRRKLSEANA